MSRLQAWHARCADLWKARKAKDPEQWAKELDESKGPWEGSISRADAAAHARTLGGLRAARRLPKIEPGSLDEAVTRLYSETAQKGGSARKAQQRASWDVWDQDSLNDPIQPEALKHYAVVWGSHFDRLSHGTTIKNPRKGAQATLLVPSHIVRRRNAQLKANNIVPDIQDADWDVLHTAGHEALRSGAVPVKDANRFRVMTDALKLVRNDRRTSDEARPFQPTFGALDTASLSVMRAGLQRMHSTGMPETSQRLLPVVEAAMAAHQAFPFMTASKAEKRRFGSKEHGYVYPGLHAMDSDQFFAQRKIMASMGHNAMRQKKAAMGASVPQPTTAKRNQAPMASTESAWPTSYSDYQERRERGESFPSSTSFERHVATLRRQHLDKSLTRAMSGQRLRTSWNQWRRGAA